MAIPIVVSGRADVLAFWGFIHNWPGMVLLAIVTYLLYRVQRGMPGPRLRTIGDPTRMFDVYYKLLNSLRLRAKGRCRPWRWWVWVRLHPWIGASR
jgi:hypothetical protein